MEQDEHAFKPQWLRQDAVKAAGTASIFAAPSPRADYQGKGGSSRNHASGRDRHPSSRKSSGSNGSRRADRDGMGKSRGYANFGRNREKDREKEFDSRDRESRPVALDRDGFQSFSTCKPERDRLNRARLKAETRNKGVVSLNNDSTSRSNADVSSSKSYDVVSTSESSTVVSTPVSTAAVSTPASNAGVSASGSSAGVSASVSSAGVSNSVGSAALSNSNSVGSAALSTSRSNAADASRSSAAETSRSSAAETSRSNAADTSRNNAALSASKSNSALTTSRSNSALSTSRSNAALSTSRSNAALNTPRNNAVVSTPRNNAAGMDFEREFPQLSLEDKNGKQGISRVPSPGISTPIQNVPLINASDGWNSVLADLPLLKDVKKSLAASSVLQTAPSKQTEALPNSGTALSMAETVMQAPLRISVGPQLSIEAQKMEERTLRQYTLRPLTPPASKSSVLTSSKTKSARMGDPIGPSKTAQQLKMHSANGPVRAPVKIDISKLSQSGSFQVLNREQNGTVHSRDCPSIPVSPPARSVSMEAQKKPVVSQKFKIATHELSLPLQAPCGDRKSNARDKHRFFESLRTKSSNGSSTALETGCQQFPSSLVDVKQDSSLNLGNDQSVFPTGMKCMGNGKCSCEEENSSEGSQRHLSDNEDNSSSVKTDIADGVSQELLEDKKEADLSSEPADTGDEEFQLSLSDSAEGSSFSAPADSDDGFSRSQTGNEEGSLSSEATEPEDEEYPAEPPPEDKPFLISLGWREDEVVQPLGLEEIADSVKGCAELEKKLWSMESNANVRVILLSILGGAK